MPADDAMHKRFVELDLLYWTLWCIQQQIELAERALLDEGDDDKRDSRQPD